MDESTARLRHPDSMRQALLWALLSTLVLFILAPTVGDAQVPVVTNITSTTGAGDLGTLITPTGNLYDITHGTRPGGGPNLFHSFGDFTVGSGDIANFLNDSGLTTTNIIGRVTELGVAHTSYIYGTIQTTGFDVGGVPTNLFLVNPNGIVFGPQGSLNVGGSVSFSTAQYLRLFDGVNSANFYANPANDGLANSILVVDPVANFGFLSSAAPVAYGFLTAPDPSATITVQGSFLQVPITLDPVTGLQKASTLSLVGGNINIVADPATGTPATLIAPSGQINLVSVTSPGEILFPGLATGPNIEVPVTTMGTVTINGGATLDVSGQVVFDANGNPIGGNSGTVFVRGGQLVMDASTIQAFTLGAVDGASKAVDIQVLQDVALTTGSAIFTLAFGPGAGGGVQLTADTVSMGDRATIFTGTFNANGAGIAGDVALNARTISLMGGSSIQSQSQSLTPGLGHGNVTIQGLQGPGSAAESVTLSGSSSLASTTFDLGDGGQVAITAQSLTMEGADTSINASTNGVGHGGDIVVQVQHASLLEGATIKTLTGSADPNAPTASTVTVQGLNGLMADSVALSGFGSGIVSETTGSARSGHVTVESNMVSLTGGAVIQTGTLGSTGAGGDVTINAGSFDISGGGRISSLSAAESAGQVTIKADTLILDNVSIETFTTSSGKGGDVVLDVGSVSLSNGATINSSTSGTGRAGDIIIAAGQLVTVDSGSNITANTVGQGNAGNVLLGSVGTVTVTNGSEISTSAQPPEGFSGQPSDLTGIAGNIAIATGNSLVVSNGGTISSVSQTGGNAGAISIFTPSLTLDNGIITTSASSTGNAGGITATVGALTLTNAAEVSSSSTVDATGAAGSVIIQGLASPADSVTLTDSSLLTSAGGTGRGGSIKVDATNVTLTNAKVSASVNNFDNSLGSTDGPTSGLGNIALTSSTMHMAGGTVTAATSGARNAGQVIITAPTLSLNDATITTSTSSSGDAGGITATVETMNLTNGSNVSSNSTGTLSGAGDAGSVNLKASGSFTSNGSTVSTSAENAKGGDILIDTQSVQLSDGTSISASSNAPFSDNGEGNAGNITIKSASNVLIQNSAVTTEASAASGGNIKILAPDAAMIHLVNSKVSTSVGGLADKSDGGNITIDPQFVVLQNSQVIAQAVAGAGGAIDITAASAFISDPLSIVNASSTLGISGTVNIQSPLQNVGGELTALTQEFSSAAALLAQQCAARAADGKFSTFVVAAREGLPMEPGGFLASPSLTAELLGPSLSLRDPQSQFSAVTGLFPKYDAKPIQLAKLGSACHQ